MKRRVPRFAVRIAFVLCLFSLYGCTIRRERGAGPDDEGFPSPPPPRAEVVSSEIPEPSPFLEHRVPERQEIMREERDRPALPHSSTRRITSEPSRPREIGAIPLEEAFPSSANTRPQPSPAAPKEDIRQQTQIEAVDRPSREERPREVEVQPGDTLWGIARRYGLMPQDFVAWNPGLSIDDRLVVGQLLQVPQPEDAAPPPSPRPAPDSAGPGRGIHVIQPGETLWTVARSYETTVLELMKINSIVEASSLRVGREIFVPVSAEDAVEEPSARPSSAPSRTSTSDEHLVRKGDTLWSVSRRYGISVEDLLAWNDLEDMTSLPVGTRLVVSADSAEPVAPPSPTRPAPEPTPSAPTPPPRPASAGPAFDWPLRGEIIRNFGWYDQRPHTGIDIAGQTGAPVRAAADGKVLFSGPMRGYAIMVILDHENGYFTVYGNLLDAAVEKGSADTPTRVRRGSVIGRIGATAEGPQPALHFEIRKGNTAIAPLRFLTY